MRGRWRARGCCVVELRRVRRGFVVRVVRLPAWRRSRASGRSSPAHRAASARRRRRPCAEGAHASTPARAARATSTSPIPRAACALRRRGARRARRPRHPRQQRGPLARPRPGLGLARGGRARGDRDERARPDAHDPPLHRAPVASGDGHIVNIGSVAGIWSYANGSSYVASKFAVHGYTRALRDDLHGKPVRVTNVAAGLVETDFSRCASRATRRRRRGLLERRDGRPAAVQRTSRTASCSP